VADLDSTLTDRILETESIELIQSGELHAAVKRVASRSHAAPVLLGSSYKNLGVQPLMDSIIRSGVCIVVILI
jgi:elongation factor G